ncbi:hypothetical protein [Serratia ureilytica]|uniref:hypothetical protein n=1 Tax=Serratia ureilytica TaxID=300181 RepID=UPI0018D5E1FF|nr:hypothetical protein [Serratia ureilytica]MBH3008156.1 hypothetical protein [Serratia ureilytica]MBH3022830.1 hypothetical protein [Serratia ureilytica]MBH3108709.1 hypothetical protein [Serratia ureilytica]MBH3176103.1 hypothetical protein [Serratia ureilytica]QQU62276.1 hypothetical protein I6I46_19650 [Serratia ureilytica]
MMNETKQQHAYQCGVRIANLWKRIKGTILKWDACCVAKARSHKLPSWCGHFPIAIALIASLTAALLGGVAIAGCLLFIWAIAFILQNTDFSNMQVPDRTNESVDDDGYSAGPEGFGNYVGGTRIDNK